MEHSETQHRPTAAAGEGRRFAERSERMRPRRRSARYIMAIHRLDRSVEHGVDVREVTDTVLAEFEGCAAVPVSIVAECRLGAPFEVHTLDIGAGRLRHHRLGERLSPLLERARALAADSEQMAVEIYERALVAIREAGSAIDID